MSQAVPHAARDAALHAVLPEPNISNSQASLNIALLGYRSNPFSGGQGVYIKYLSRALHALGHRVDVISGPPYPDLDKGIRLIKVPSLDLYATESPVRALRPQHLASATDLFEWLSMLSGGFPEPYTFGRRLTKLLAQLDGRYDIIHDNQSLCYGLLDLQRQNLPVVTTIHHPITHDRDIALAHAKTRTHRLLIRRWHSFLTMQTKVARQLEHIVTVSETSKRDLCQAFSVDPAKVKVIHNGIDTDEFRPNPDIQRRPFQLITTASADQPLKGSQHLLRALHQLVGVYPDLRLTFIGQPKPGGSTERLIRQLNLVQHIDYRYGINSQEIASLYAQATIAVTPSEYEGFGLPAGEAMACAVPVVSSDGGALPEVVGDAGIVVPKADPSALAAAIADLLDHPDKAQHLGMAGYDRIQQHFSWRHVAEELTSYYQGLVR